MKHARKMILVDAATHAGGAAAASQNLNKNIEPLTDAIKSLANSAEFNRTNFGPTATIVSRLHNNLNQILDRKDLDPSTKLKLYNQELKQFLFLHRQSDQKPAPTSTPTSTPATLPATGREERMPDLDFWWDTESLPGSELGAIGGYPREPVVLSTPPREPRFSDSPISYMDIDPLRGKKRASESEPEPIELEAKKLKRASPQNIPRTIAKSKYRSNLPRTTPKNQILRQNPTRKRKGSFDYFEDWISKKRKI